MVIGEILNMGLYQWCSGLLFPANNIERKVCVKEINNKKRIERGCEMYCESN
jgi:hypothetical protein